MNLTGRVHLDRVDASTLDAATAAEMAATTNAALAADRLAVPPTNGAAIAAQARHTSTDEPYDGLWLARDEGGRLVGWASLELPTWDNTHMGLVFCSVHPERRGQGVGTALLDQQMAATRAAGRTLLLTFAFRKSTGTQFLLASGFEVGQETAQRRIEPQRLNYDWIASLADAAATAAADYELVEFEGTTPEALLPAMSTMFEAINDAPLDDAALEADSYPVERVRRYEAAMAARGQRVYRLVARSRRTKEEAGLTILCVDELRPGIAMQEDTSVLPAHRGHRLGLLLKSRMLLWMRERHPELVSIDTWNADSNEHMIRVNDQLGAVVVNRGYLLQHHLDLSVVS